LQMCSSAPSTTTLLWLGMLLTLPICTLLD
jgi:hypothetical protein